MLEAQGITKRFPGVLALDDVALRVRRASCHALVGENGAGKSTLGKVLAGLIRPDAGQVLLEGKPVRFGGPLDAIRAGIGIVHQELAFCENLSVAENLCLDDPPARGLFVDHVEMERRTKAWLQRINLDVDPWHLVGDLPISKQQLAQVAGAVGRGAKVLIFDEPTSSLSLYETQVLFEQIRELRSQGVSCIYVSHRMEEVFELCDTVTVLRDGHLVGTCPVADLTRDDLVRMMIGRVVEGRPSERGVPFGPELLRVAGLSSPRKFTDIGFAVRGGEIVGLAGLVGSGRTEVALAIFGLDPFVQGEVAVAGQIVEQRSPTTMMRMGVGLVPEDRKRYGLVLGMSAKDNISLPVLDSLSRFGWVNAGAERELAAKFFAAMRVKAPSLDAVAAGLSGGNQQKLVIAKWLAAQCRVLILDEPTRGVDVGAKTEIHSLVRAMASEGRGVVVSSSELPELLNLCDRILVLRNGRLVGEVLAGQATEEGLMRLMTGVETMTA
ncbi:MAG: ribose import ATP-binding protein RbsA 2 [Fimbriimonadales bacterium]